MSFIVSLLAPLTAFNSNSFKNVEEIISYPEEIIKLNQFILSKLQQVNPA